MDVSNLSLIPHILISACVFHNYVIEVEGEEWPEDEVENDNGEDEIEEEGEVPAEVEAVSIRNDIANSL